MPASRWRAVLSLYVLVGAVLTPALVFSQAGYYITPSLTVSELHSDNVEFAPKHRESDWITRVGPGIRGGYESEPLTIIAGYNFDAEWFKNLTEFNTAMARQKAIFEFRYLPLRTTTLSFKSEYNQTKSPGDLNEFSGIPFPRARAQRILAEPTVEHRFDPLTTGTLGYSFTQDSASFGVTTETHAGKMGLDRRITRQDALGLEYEFKDYIFTGEEDFLIVLGTKILDRVPIFSGRDTVQSHIIGLKWTHDFTPQTSFSVRAGPRFSEGSVDPDVFTSLKHRFQQGEVTLEYRKSQNPVVGERGLVNTDGVTLTAKYKPLRQLELTAMPSFFRNTLNGQQVTVYKVKLEAAYAITRWLSLVGTYERLGQNGIFIPSAVFTTCVTCPADLALAGISRHANITSNVIGVSLVFKDRFRID